METQAGRVVANELASHIEGAGAQQLDEVGRTRLRTICKEFHDSCRKMSREEEIANLHWRVQKLHKQEENCLPASSPPQLP